MEIMVWVVVLLAMSLLAGAYFNNVEIRQKNGIRQMYVDLVKEKLDIIRSALAMGYSDQALSELDQRLERLIGSEKMLQTLRTEGEALSVKVSDPKIPDNDMEREVEQVKQAHNEQQQ